MVVYDAQKRATFENLPKWLEQVEENGEEGCVRMIVAAKGGEGGDEVSNDEGAEFAKKNGCLFADFSSNAHNLAFDKDKDGGLGARFASLRIGDGETVEGKRIHE